MALAWDGLIGSCLKAAECMSWSFRPKSVREDVGVFPCVSWISVTNSPDGRELFMVPLVFPDTVWMYHNCHTLICRDFTWPRRGSWSAWNPWAVLPCTPTSTRLSWESASSEPLRSRNASSGRTTWRWMRIRKLIIPALWQTGTSGAAVWNSSYLGRTWICWLCSLPVIALGMLVQGREVCVDKSVAEMFCSNFCDEIKITSESLAFLRIPALLLGYIIFKVLFYWFPCSESSCS